MATSAVYDSASASRYCATASFGSFSAAARSSPAIFSSVDRSCRSRALRSSESSQVLVAKRAEIRTSVFISYSTLWRVTRLHGRRVPLSAFAESLQRHNLSIHQKKVQAQDSQQNAVAGDY